jgi:hypothetical protein
MHLADVEGDLDAAIAIFKEVAADPRASRETAAAALVGLEDAVRRLQRPRQTAVRTWSGPGVDGSGSLSPDGRYLTFGDWTPATSRYETW